MSMVVILQLTHSLITRSARISTRSGTIVMTTLITFTEMTFALMHLLRELQLRANGL